MVLQLKFIFVLERAKQPPACGSPVGFHTDNEGHPSTLRVKTSMCLIVALVLVLSDTSFQEAEPSKTELMFYFLIAAFVPKVALKYF